MKVLIMGVSGIGKTSVAKSLAPILSYPYIEADDFHSYQARLRMRRGIALQDGDRIPWLRTLAQHLAEQEKYNHGWVCACSALKAQYRSLLSSICPYTHLVHLHAPYPYVRSRILRQRHYLSVSTHFMPLSLLKSQYETLQCPSIHKAIIVDSTKPIERVISSICFALGVSPFS